jgi:hemolysin activation/secretion protein
MEQIAVGGSRTVRGYRENQFVRDSGVIGSVELRVPVLRGIFGGDVLQVAPFGDVAHVWSSPDRLEAASPPSETIASLGVGLRYDWLDRLSLRVYWGGRLIEVPKPHDDLQDYGLYLAMRFRAL